MQWRIQAIKLCFACVTYEELEVFICVFLDYGLNVPFYAFEEAERETRLPIFNSLSIHFPRFEQ